MLRRHRFLLVNSVLLLAVMGAWWGRRVESAVFPSGNFLAGLRLPFRDWRATELPLTRDELSLLEPDATLVRNYAAPDERGAAQLAVIAGHRKRTVHTPGFCMTGGGWELLAQQAATLRLPDRKVPAMRQRMVQEGRQALITYFFTDGETETRSLVRFQAFQVLKRFRGELPMGALVRVIVPIGDDPGAAERLTEEFARATLPPVLASVRRARGHLE